MSVSSMAAPMRSASSKEWLPWATICVYMVCSTGSLKTPGGLEAAVSSTPYRLITRSTLCAWFSSLAAMFCSTGSAHISCRTVYTSCAIFSSSRIQRKEAISASVSSLAAGVVGKRPTAVSPRLATCCGWPMDSICTTGAGNGLTAVPICPTWFAVCAASGRVVFSVLAQAANSKIRVIRVKMRKFFIGFLLEI